MLFQECGSKNAGAAGCAEAFGIRAIGKAGKYLCQHLRNDVLVQAESSRKPYPRFPAFLVRPAGVRSKERTIGGAISGWKPNMELNTDNFSRDTHLSPIRAQNERVYVQASKTISSTRKCI